MFKIGDLVIPKVNEVKGVGHPLQQNKLYKVVELDGWNGYIYLNDHNHSYDTNRLNLVEFWERDTNA